MHRYSSLSPDDALTRRQTLSASSRSSSSADFRASSVGSSPYPGSRNSHARSMSMPYSPENASSSSPSSYSSPATRTSSAGVSTQARGSQSVTVTTTTMHQLRALSGQVKRLQIELSKSQENLAKLQQQVSARSRTPLLTRIRSQKSCSFFSALAFLYLAFTFDC